MKRVLPFMAAFAFGLFVASFFVDIGPRTGCRDHRMRHFQEMQQLRMERDELRQENLRLRNQHDLDIDDPLGDMQMDLDVSEPVPPPPPPPRIRR
jgi:hypothetical protein